MSVLSQEKISIIKNEAEFEYTTSRGPGGQNVNKTSTAALLRWTPLLSAALTQHQQDLLLNKLANKLTTEGYIIIRSDSHRDQNSNRKAGLEKLILLITQALHVPKARKKTKPSKSSKRKRLDSKSIHGETKKLRGKVGW